MGITTNQLVRSDMAVSMKIELDELWLARQIRVALSHLEQALCAPPVQRATETGHAMRVLFSVEEMIVTWGLKGCVQSASRLPLVWRQLDSALQLIEGLEVPTTGRSKKALTQARDILHAVLVAGLL